MKKFQTILIILFTALFSSCETGENMISEASTTSFSVRISWQANAERVYRATFNEKEISLLGSGFTVHRDNLSGVLKVYQGEETSPELEETINFLPRQKIELVQLPDSPIMLAAAGGEEENPSNRNSVKVRFFYKDIPEYGNKIVLDFYATTDNKTFTPFGESITLEEGKLSEYIELNLNLSYPSITKRVVFKYDIKSPEGEILFSHTGGSANRINYWDGSKIPELKENGWETPLKLATCRLRRNNANLVRFLFAFGIPWEE